jgi:1-acyl-sn-glycerol-3-phosphate acyltransferase
LGLGENPGDDLALTSLVTLLQFNLSGMVLNKVPGFHRLNQSIQMQTELAIRETGARFRQHLAETFQGPRGPEQAWAAASDAPISGETRDAIPDMSTMRVVGSKSGQPGSIDPAEQTPASGHRVASTPPANGAPNKNGAPTAPSIPVLDQLAHLYRLAKHINFSAHADPSRPLPPIPTEQPKAPIRSIAEGRLRVQAQGQDDVTLAFMRWGAQQLEYSRQCQDAFFNLMERTLTTQAQLAKRLDPILRQFPKLDFERDNQLARTYLNELDRLTQGASREFVEACLIHKQTRDLRTRDDYLNLQDADLIAMGIAPEARDALSNNAAAFAHDPILQTRFRRILAHPLLQGLAETQTLAEAFETYLEPSRPNQGQQTSLSGKEYVAKQIPLTRALRNFLADPLQARVFLIENVRQDALVRGVLGASPEWIAEQLIQARHEVEISETTNEDIARFHRAHAALKLIEGRSLPARIFYGARRVFNMDPYTPIEVQGCYHRALFAVIEHLPTDLWQLPSIGDTAAIEARSAYHQARAESTQRLRQALDRLAKAKDDFWAEVDWRNSKAAPTNPTDILSAYELNLMDLEFQLLQVRELAEVLQQAEKGSGKKCYEACQAKIAQAEEALGDYRSPEKRGKHNVERNETVERILDRIIVQAYQDVTAALHRLRHPAAGYRPVSVRMLPAVDKLSTPWTDRFGESWPAVWPLAWKALVGSFPFLSALERKAAAKVADAQLVEYSTAVLMATGSRIVVDPHVDAIVEAGSLVCSSKHTSWLDFLLGGAPLLRAAQLQGRHESRDVLGIAAKANLPDQVGPIFAPAIRYFTEGVPSDPAGYDHSVTNLALAMAMGDRTRGRTEPYSTEVFDELGMPWEGQVDPLNFNPFPNTSAITELSHGGRSLLIADRYMAITGKAPDILLATPLGGYPLWPKPNRPFPLREGPMTTVTQLVPMLALRGNTAKARSAGPADWIRTLWLMHAMTPEYRSPIASIERIFEPFAAPGDLAVEGRIAEVCARACGTGTPLEGVYPTAEQVHRLETEAQGTNIFLNPPLHRALDAQTRRLLRIRLSTLDQRLERELTEHPQIAEAGRLRRAQRILRSRLKLLGQVERKAKTHEELTLTERTFVEKAGAAVAGRSNTAGTDRILEQLEFYFETQDHGETLQGRLMEAQGRYYDLVEQWTTHRADPAREEHQQLMVQEAAGYEQAWRTYRVAIETFFELNGDTPKRWEGALFPEMKYYRHGDEYVIEPLGWKPDTSLSVGALLSLLTTEGRMGIIPVGYRSTEIDPSLDLYRTLHRGWGERAWQTTQTQIRIQNSQRLAPLQGKPVVLAPTHNSWMEFPSIAAVMHSLGYRTTLLPREIFFHPVARALIGDLRKFSYPSIGRLDSAEALEAINQVGDRIRVSHESDTKPNESIGIFPEMTRGEVEFDEGGHRREGPIRRVKGGVGVVLARAKTALVPLGLSGGGEIIPKEGKGSNLHKGAGLGRTYTFNFGDPLSYDQIAQGSQTTPEIRFRRAAANHLNTQFPQLVYRHNTTPLPEYEPKQNPARQKPSPRPPNTKTP